MDELDAVFAFLTALAVSVAVTPLTARLARRLGAVDEPGEHGLAERSTPRLGGAAILAGVLLAGALWLPGSDAIRGILGGAAAITAVGALDDVFDLPPPVKLLGQVGAALIPVLAGVRVEDFTLPFLGRVDLGLTAGGALTLVGLVIVVNVVNLSDGVDGLAAGVCTISAVTFSIIAFDLAAHSPRGQRPGIEAAAVLAALVAGASLGFLFHNFHPAAVFMGDSGSNLLGLLLGCVAVQGTLKTNAVIALIFPLVILAVPFLDTGFVVAKRIKYGKAVWMGDTWHFHHRFANIGFSQRRTVVYLYAWTLVLATLALALRFVPYSDDHGNLDAAWTAVLVACGLIALAASVYLIVVLEIFKFKRVRSRQLRGAEPGTDEHELEAQVAHELETGEFETVRPPG